MAQKYKQYEPSPIMEDEQSKFSDDEPLDHELQATEDDIVENSEDVLAMAMAEKANALLRGKSEDFDRTFVPRVVNQMTPSPDVAVILEQADGEKRSPPTTTDKLPRPGAFSLSRRNASEGDVALAEYTSTGEEESVENDKIILIPRASLVSAGTNATELDLECTMNAQESPQIAEVVKMPSSDMVQNGNAQASRRKKVFRWLILLVLLTIAAALVALLVEVMMSDKRDEENGGRKPPSRDTYHSVEPPPRDTNPSVEPSVESPSRDTYPSVDGDDSTEYDDDDRYYESDGDYSEMYGNSTRRIWI